MSHLVVGASGYVGRHLLRALAALGPVVGTSTAGGNGLRALDLSAPDLAVLDVLQPDDVLFLCAAISAPDVCSRDRPRAWQVNVEGASSLIDAALSRGARVVFFSSDTVYGEAAEPVDETAACQPAGEYAQMKHEVERRHAGRPGVRVLRLSYVFSREDKFTGYLQRCAEQGTDAEIFHPFYRAVVHLEDVVGACVALARHWNVVAAPIINVGGPQVLARTEFAQTLTDNGLPALKYRITEPGPEFFLNRPRVIRMVSPHLEQALGRPARTLRDAARLEFAKD